MWTLAHSACSAAVWARLMHYGPYMCSLPAVLWLTM